MGHTPTPSRFGATFTAGGGGGGWIWGGGGAVRGGGGAPDPYIRTCVPRGRGGRGMNGNGQHFSNRKNLHKILCRRDVLLDKTGTSASTWSVPKVRRRTTTSDCGHLWRGAVSGLPSIPHHFSSAPPPPPLCDILSGCCFFTGPWTVTRFPFACCVGSLRSVGRCGRCSCWCRFRVRGAQ